MYAPIVLFAFNRLEPLKACVASLLQNTEAAKTDLIVFVDGPRVNKEGEAEKVEAVRQYVKTITGFHELETHFSEENKKLGPSIIAGVTDVINRYGKAIVIEDDLIASRNLLAFMNQGLDRYENNKEVWSICGYSNKVKVPKDYNYDAYFCSRSSSWGWATWKDRWFTCDWELKDWDTVIKNGRAFNRWGGSDCYGMLKDWKEGRNQSWAIRFCYNQFVQKAVSLFPLVSKIDNEGFDGNGTNCTLYNRFKFDFDESESKDFRMPESYGVNPQLLKEAMKYHTIATRIHSRLMNNIGSVSSERDMEQGVVLQ